MDRRAYHSTRVPMRVYPCAANTYLKKVRPVRTTVCSGKVVPNPTTVHSSSNRSRCIMDAHPQSITQATLVGEREGLPQVPTVGLGVTKTALDVFNNFVHLVAENVAPTTAATTNLQANKPHPRRSKRFATHVEDPAPCPNTLPAPPLQQVRSSSNVPCGFF